MLPFISAEEAVANVQSGNRVFFQGAAMTPKVIIKALCERYQELSDIELVQMHTEGDALYAQEPYNKSFHVNSCCGRQCASNRKF